MTIIDGITLRAAAPPDWPAVSALLADAGLPLAGALDHFTGFIVATSGETLVGCVGHERYGEAGLLRSLAVSPSSRDRGVARALVDRCLGQARSNGVRTLALLTTTAEGYFARLGFTRVERAAVPAALLESAEFRGACPSTAIAMTLDLDP